MSAKNTHFVVLGYKLSQVEVPSWKELHVSFA